MRTSRQTIPGWLISIIMVLIVALAVAQSSAFKTQESRPTIQAPAGSTNSYVAAIRSQQMIYLSGKGPRLTNGEYLTGKLGKELNARQGYAAARGIAIAQVSELRGILGDLSKVKQIIKVSAFVNSMPDFTGQSEVANGFSDYIISIYGERGRHARTSVGVSSLPQNMAVEIEMIVEIEPKIQRKLKLKQ